MRLRLRELPDGLHELRLDKTVLSNTSPFSNLTGLLTVDKNGAYLRVRGSLGFTARMECGRCLADVTRDFTQEVAFVYRPRLVQDDRPDKPDVELHPDDLDLVTYQGQEIDLWPQIAEAMELALPMKPLCRQDCAGICPFCGRDLNDGPCQCTDDAPDPRWDKLRHLADRR